MNKKIHRWIGALVVMGALTAKNGGAAEVVGRLVATVDGQALYFTEFQENWQSFLEQQERTLPPDQLTPEWKQKTRLALLDQMIEEKVLLTEAKRRKIVVPKRQLEEGIRQVKNRFKLIARGSEVGKEDYERELTAKEKEIFQAELKKQGITEKEFETRINEQLMVMRLTEDEVRSRVAVPFKETGSPANADARELTSDYAKKTQALYEEIEKKFNDPAFKPRPDSDVDELVLLLRQRLGEAVKARHILIRSPRSDDFKKRQAALEKAKAIRKKLAGGSDFVDVAKQKSEGPTAKSGGDLGWLVKGETVPEFEKIAFSLPVGGLSDVVETEFGYHILTIEEKKAPRRLRYDELKEDLVGFIYQMESKDRYEQFVGDLRKKSDIKVLMDVNKY